MEYVEDSAISHRESNPTEEDNNISVCIASEEENSDESGKDDGITVSEVKEHKNGDRYSLKRIE
jgi:hypothetical protein